MEIVKDTPKQKAKKHRKILVVDDDLLLRNMMKEVLQDKNYLLEVAATGKEVIEKLSTEAFDVIVVDLVLPDIYGIDLIKMVRAQRPDVQFIVVTAHPDMDAVIQALKFQAIDFLRKPFSQEELVHAIERAMRLKELEEERSKFLQELEAKLRRLEVIHDVITFITSTTDFDELVRRIMKQVKNFLRVDGCTLFFYDSGKEELYFKEVIGGSGGEQLKEIRLKVGDGIAGRVALTRKSLVVNNAYQNPYFYSGIDKKTGYLTYNLMAVPLEFRGQLIGVLEVVNKENREDFTQDDLQFLEILAKHITVAIYNARASQELKRAREYERIKKEQFEKLLNEKMKELEEYHKKLSLTEKLASLGELTAGIAHELNNPISFVAGNAEIMKDYLRRLRAMIERIKDPSIETLKNQMRQIVDELEEMSDEMQEGSKRVVEIVSDLKRFARGDVEEKRIVSLRDVVGMAERILYPKLSQPKVKCSLSFNGDIFVRGNESQLTQVVLNLLSNAVDAVLEKGEGEISVRTYKQGDAYAVIEVRDTGVGMDESTKRRIFDPFFTTKPPGKGTGLGLSITYRIVKNHDGDITVESIKGAGTTFKIVLPAVDLEEKDRSQQQANNCSGEVKHEERRFNLEQ